MQLIIWKVIVAYQCMIKGQNKARASFVLTAQRGTITGMRTTVSWSTTLVHTKIIQQRHQWIESFFVVPFEYPNI